MNGWDDRGTGASGRKTVAWQDECGSSCRAGRSGTERGTGGTRQGPCMVAMASFLVMVLVLAAGCTQTGSLLVSSEPAGAHVSVNGAEKGVTPLELGDLPEGYYLVALRSDGYINEQRNISVSPGSKETVAFTLTPLPAVPGKKYSTVTDLNTGAVRNRLYAGGWRIDASGSSVSDIVVTIGRDAADDPEPFPLDGADVVIAGKKNIVVLKQDTPLYNQGIYPRAGSWNINNKLNSYADNAVDRNEQFTLVLIPGPGQAIPFSDPLTVEIRPRIGAAAVFVPPGSAPAQGVQAARPATSATTAAIPATGSGSPGSPAVPYAITSGGNSPEGAVYSYFTAMDRGDAATGLDLLLMYALMPDDQKTAMMQNATSASARTFGKNGEGITLANMMVTAKEPFPICQSGDATQNALCRSNITDAYRMTVIMDETLSGQSKSSRSYTMLAVLYRGSWKLVP
ncbi:MAG: PEGA domain protein [Methanoregula sp. PtaU1.Bin006]|nr:MAG: PEGA domain protein [Methanoregula sp. PtaB.Bin085]OPY33490.1 MAG: PEGA domain protein [Methanoregula sp. PtaU1.Bin006]